ncbi:metallophosphoesterase [Priestia megaterium]
MKVDYASDLHFNHWMRWTENQIKLEKRIRELTNRLIENGNGEVLVLAGDFSEYNSQALWILDEAAKSYERVYWTFGNHDLYLVSKSQKKKYGDSMGRLDELITESHGIKNVVPLVKNVDVYKGKTFAGDAMWYLPQNLKDWTFYRAVSNDSGYISINGYSKNDMTKKMHNDSIKWYQTLKNRDIDVFVSHVPPLHPPESHEKPNGCYQTIVPFMNTKHWICGHQHLQCEFDRARTRFHMNAIGYRDHYSNPPAINEIPRGKIDKTKSFGIRTFEI